MAAPSATTPTLQAGKTVTLNFNDGTSKTFAITTKNITEASEKIQTNNQKDNGAASHIYGFKTYSGDFEMHVDSAQLPLFASGSFYGCEWVSTAWDSITGTVGFSSLRRTANPNGGYMLSGQFEFTGAVTKDLDVLNP